MAHNTLKSPFFISIIFHCLVILSIPILYQPARQAMLDITAIEMVQMPKEENTAPQTIEKKEEPKKIAKTPPPVPKKEEIREEVKKEPEKILEEQKTAPGSELPAPQQLAEAEPAVPNTDAPEVTDSKYALEGGTGKGDENELTLFRTMVRSKIEKAKFYPMWARKRGFEGVVGVQFVIKPDGNVMGLKVVRPCHCEALNKAACEAIMKAAPFNPRPEDITDREMVMEVDITYRLN